MLDSIFPKDGSATDIALIIVLVFAAWELLQGLRRGVARQILHTVFTAIAAVAAFFSASYLADNIVAELGNLNVEEILMEIETAIAPDTIPAGIADAIRGMDVGILSSVLSMPLALIFPPVAFILLFIVYALAAKIVCFIVQLILRLPRRGLGRRLSGMVFGAIEGIAVALILLLPVAGLSGLVVEAGEIIEEDGSESELVYEESPVISIARKLGGDAMIERFATVEIDGKEYDLREEFINLIVIIDEAAAMGEPDFAALTEEEKATMDSVLDKLYASEYLTKVASGALTIVGTAIQDSTIDLEVDESYKGLLNATAGVFANSTPDVFKTDMNDLKAAYYILSDSGVLKAMLEDSSAMSDAMTKKDAEGKTVVTRVTAILNSNARTRPIVTELTKLSLKLICDNSDTVTAELYENVKSGVADTLAIDKTSYSDPEEYKAAVTESLDTTLKENDINLEEDVVADIADYIDKNYDDLKDATDEEINNVILSYHEAYMNSQQNAEPAPEQTPAE